MAGFVTVQVDGMDALIVSLTAMQKNVPEKIINIMHEVGTDAKDVMDSHTPVRSGELKSRNQVQLEEGGFTLMNDSDHALFVEEGTRKMSAQPFLAPAVEFAIQELNQRLPEAFTA